ncbi:PorP/SprF family type IX secretion system membrane protein [Flectobacillus major]|uniref:PorP/SprF family type IX secretion system membrane protein n=1 Tax=Flectobacillus major TaxID=103 RepID=UPI00047D11E6|nr:PorP/SprF family type IX secretion system membrane protein [Flectobacillus major]
MNHPKNIITFISLILVCIHTCLAQDPQFSQFHNNPLVYNPAFTGHTKGSRFISNFRKQWLGLGFIYQTTSASYDANIDDEKRLSLGMQVMLEQESENFRQSTGSGLMSYRVGGELSGFTAGLKASYINRSFTTDGLKFIDQYSATGIANTSLDPLANSSGRFTQNFFDFSLGLLYEAHQNSRQGSVYNVNMRGFQMGVALHHFDKLLKGVNYSLPLPHLGVHASYKMPINLPWWYQDTEDESTLGFTGYFRSQGQSMMLDLGITTRYTPIVLGLWYRGIPLRTYKDIPQQDAIVVLMGYEQEKFRLGISYDVTVSSLSWRSGGTIELSLWLSFGYVNFKGTKAGDRHLPQCTKRTLFKPW